MADDTMTKIYIHKFRYDQAGYARNSITIEEVEVKETPKQYRCIKKNEYPFDYSSVLDKSQLDKVIKKFEYVIYSLNKLDMETFKQIFVDYLESKRDQYKKKITELDNCQEVFESLLKEKNEL